ncbi:vWA domain-containing protein [Haloferula sp.]|uniref:vWA domain-containing protein n=1 Tax=Haloferula sp. TaxID=2497595 RepID=UPI00329B4E51
MSELMTPPEGPDELHVSEHAAQLELLLARQRRVDSIQSLIVSLIIIGLIAAVLFFISLQFASKDAEVIVSYAAPPEAEENPVDRPDMAIGAKPKPTSASSSMARVIAAAVEAPLNVPMPEESNPTTLFGIDDDFTAGFGAGDGDGDGGGGSSFFGTPRPGRRIIYIVDFSESMNSSAEGGGTRLDAAKKELNRSIGALKTGSAFNVIFFSSTAWTIETDGPKHDENGWNGLNEPPPIAWHPATEQVKAAFAKEVNSMGVGRGTVWFSPLKMALSMTPRPDTIYMLSDGEPSDLDYALNRIDSMNPDSIPVDTIALESPGSAAYAMNEMANETGGRFTLIYKGKAISGLGAEKFLSDDFDD